MGEKDSCVTYGIIETVVRQQSSVVNGPSSWKSLLPAPMLDLSRNALILALKTKEVHDSKFYYQTADLLSGKNHNRTVRWLPHCNAMLIR